MLPPLTEAFFMVYYLSVKDFMFFDLTFYNLYFKRSFCYVFF